jgi:hypothetical protein
VVINVKERDLVFLEVVFDDAEFSETALCWGKD